MRHQLTCPLNECNQLAPLTHFALDTSTGCCCCCCRRDCSYWFCCSYCLQVASATIHSTFLFSSLLFSSPLIVVCVVPLPLPHAHLMGWLRLHSFFLSLFFFFILFVASPRFFWFVSSSSPCLDFCVRPLSKYLWPETLLVNTGVGCYTLLRGKAQVFTDEMQAVVFNFSPALARESLRVSKCGRQTLPLLTFASSATDATRASCFI